MRKSIAVLLVLALAVMVGSAAFAQAPATPHKAPTAKTPAKAAPTHHVKAAPTHHAKVRAKAKGPRTIKLYGYVRVWKEKKGEVTVVEYWWHHRRHFMRVAGPKAPDVQKLKDKRVEVTGVVKHHQLEVASVTPKPIVKKHVMHKTHAMHAKKAAPKKMEMKKAAPKKPAAPAPSK